MGQIRGVLKGACVKIVPLVWRDANLVMRILLTYATHTPRRQGKGGEISGSTHIFPFHMVTHNWCHKGSQIFKFLQTIKVKEKNISKKIYFQTVFRSCFPYSRGRILAFLNSAAGLFVQGRLPSSPFHASLIPSPWMLISLERGSTKYKESGSPPP